MDPEVVVRPDMGGNNIGVVGAMDEITRGSGVTLFVRRILKYDFNH